MCRAHASGCRFPVVKGTTYYAILDGYDWNNQGDGTLLIQESATGEQSPRWAGGGGLPGPTALLTPVPAVGTPQSPLKLTLPASFYSTTANGTGLLDGGTYGGTCSYCPSTAWWAGCGARGNDKVSCGAGPCWQVPGAPGFFFFFFFSERPPGRSAPPRSTPSPQPARSSSTSCSCPATTALWPCWAQTAVPSPATTCAVAAVPCRSVVHTDP